MLRQDPNGIPVFRIEIEDFLVTADGNIEPAVILRRLGDAVGAFGLDIDRGLARGCRYPGRTGLH